MCGLFGITNNNHAARMSYFGLYAQQHRGQESAGIASYDNGVVKAKVDMGLVPDIFSEQDLDSLTGDMAIGHVRYSTTGVSARCNAQPLVVRVRGVEIALAHNGNLTNSEKLRAELEEEGAIFQTTADSEIFLHLIAKQLKNLTLAEAILEACRVTEGAYCLLIMSQGVLYAVRDPHGMHPLSIGKLEDGYVFASETCAFDLLEAEYERSVEPGEMIVVENNTLTSYELPIKGEIRQCIFELVYFARPDSMMFGEEVYACRKKMGMALAREKETDADFAMPFPDSGIYATVGYAQEAKIPYEHALIRNHYVGRTFIQPTQSMRQFGVRVKLNPVKSAIKDKKLCIVDDSIVRGTTVQARAAKLRALGAKEIHFRVSCPPVAYPCYYGIDFADPSQLVAVQHKLEDLPDLLGLDSLHYLSEEGLKSAVKEPEKYCLGCFNGVYPKLYK